MASSHSELSVLPPMYGRESAGHRATSATNQPAETITAPSAASRCQILVHSPDRPAIRYANAIAGSTSSPCSIFVRNAKPIATPANSSQRRAVRPRSVSMARTTK